MESFARPGTPEWDAELERGMADCRAAKQRAIDAGAGLHWERWGRGNYHVALDGEVIGSLSVHQAETIDGKRRVLSWSATVDHRQLPGTFRTAKAGAEAVQATRHGVCWACSAPLPPQQDLGPRRIYCDDRCRKRAQRMREATGTGAGSDARPERAERAALDERLSELADELASTAAAIRETIGTTARPRTAVLGNLAEVTDQAIRTAVDYDRANGATWKTIGAALDLHPDTARDRYGRTEPPLTVADSVP